MLAALPGLPHAETAPEHRRNRIGKRHTPVHTGARPPRERGVRRLRAGAAGVGTPRAHRGAEASAGVVRLDRPRERVDVALCELAAGEDDSLRLCLCGLLPDGPRVQEERDGGEVGAHAVHQNAHVVVPGRRRPAVALEHEARELHGRGAQPGADVLGEECGRPGPRQVVRTERAPRWP
jgi:hypothetical protein